jgi:hypothetical protein
VTFFYRSVLTRFILTDIILKQKQQKYLQASIICNVTVGFSVWFMMFNATFNNISVISWRSVLLVKEIRVPEENHRPAASH